MPPNTLKNSSRWTRHLPPSYSSWTVQEKNVYARRHFIRNEKKSASMNLTMCMTELDPALSAVVQPLHPPSIFFI